MTRAPVVTISPKTPVAHVKSNVVCTFRRLKHRGTEHGGADHAEAHLRTHGGGGCGAGRGRGASGCGRSREGTAQEVRGGGDGGGVGVGFDVAADLRGDLGGGYKPIELAMHHS